jgi:hypothetical protein
MKKLLALILFFTLVFAGPAMAGWTVVSSTMSDYKDGLGQHSVIRITITIDDNGGSFTTADIVGSVRAGLLGYMYWVGVDGVDTGTAPQLTITDPWGFTRFVFASFHATTAITVRGDVYNGQYPQIFDGSTFTFTDSGDTGQVFYLYLDMVR